MHQSIKKLVERKKNSSGGCIIDKEGNMIFENDKILRWSEYIEDLFSDNKPPQPSTSNDRDPPIF